MKYVIGLYIVMAIMVAVNLVSKFILKGEYSAIASWVIVMLTLTLLGGVLFADARYCLSRK